MPVDVRVRFAPSPTGALHIGSARTALFNYLFARRHAGRFILRIEDTDVARSESRYEAAIYDGLRWLGLEWDEGPDRGGDYGPYRQSERTGLYAAAIDSLIERGFIYRCYCTPEELALARQEGAAQGRPPRYSGRCRDVATRARLAAEGRTCVLRFAAPERETIEVHDLVRGNVSFSSADLDDFVVARDERGPLYNLAVVVDDHHMAISHVIRGEEHLANTPRQILLYRALGWEPPTFAHLPLIVNSDRSKLSKRTGDTALEAYRDAGYLPEALVNYLALLGWSSPTKEEVLTLEQLTGLFELERVSRSPSVFDIDRLNWYNGRYIRSVSDARLIELARPFLAEIGVDPAGRDDEWHAALATVLRDGSATLRDAAAGLRFLAQSTVSLSADHASEMQSSAATFALGTLRELLVTSDGATREDMRALMPRLREQSAAAGLGPRQVLMPVRLALTGESHGPDLANVLVLLGTSEAARRVELALSKQP